MGGISIRVSEELYKNAKHSAKGEFRTPPLQIAYWAKIGKIALENSDLPIDFIKGILIAREQKPEPFIFEK